MTYDLRLAERIRHLLADRHDVHEKRMFGGLAFMVKGGMCCAVSGRGGLLLRVGPDAAALAKEPHVKPMRMAGRVVKNFIRVMPEALPHDGATQEVDRTRRRLHDVPAAEEDAPSVRLKRGRPPAKDTRRPRCFAR